MCVKKEISGKWIWSWTILYINVLFYLRKYKFFSVMVTDILELVVIFIEYVLQFVAENGYFDTSFIEEVRDGYSSSWASILWKKLSFQIFDHSEFAVDKFVAEVLSYDCWLFCSSNRHDFIKKFNLNLWLVDFKFLSIIYELNIA